jgi:hypothetical protein
MQMSRINVRRAHRNRLLDHRTQLHRGAMQFNFARRCPRHIEQVINALFFRYIAVAAFPRED